jgi:hypothetical protein
VYIERNKKPALPCAAAIQRSLSRAQGFASNILGWEDRRFFGEGSVFYFNQVPNLVIELKDNLGGDFEIGMVYLWLVTSAARTKL